MEKSLPKDDSEFLDEVNKIRKCNQSEPEVAPKFNYNTTTVINSPR